MCSSDLARQGVLCDLLGRAVQEDFSVVDQVGPVGDGEGFPYVVIRDEHAVSPFPQSLDHGLDVVDRDGVDAAEGLVQQDEVGLEGQGPRDLHAAAFASGEGVAAGVGDMDDAEHWR